jgi:DEAD/DEAH box helicase domain-containing protein
MRLVEALRQPDAIPACPQCGHDRDASSQMDRGQQRRFVEFARSQALSYMEHYESLAGDRSDERQREYYQTIRSFDLTQEAPSGAVGDDDLPFGIEYRAAVVLREVNAGYQGEPGVVACVAIAPEEGFKVCQIAASWSYLAIPTIRWRRRSCRPAALREAHPGRPPVAVSLG